MRGWDSFDFEGMAWYSAIVDGDGPARFLYIAAEAPGREYGYVAMHHFLDRVGVGNEFLCTYQTEAGKKLFDRLVRDGVLEAQGALGDDVAYPKRYTVRRDPIENLTDYAAEPSASKAVRSNVEPHRELCGRATSEDSVRSGSPSLAERHARQRPGRPHGSQQRR